MSPIKKMLSQMCLLLLPFLGGKAIAYDTTDFGQLIQIQARFDSVPGKAIWSLIIRDVDGNENIPYLFDIGKGEHFWMARTQGRNYLITASTLQIEIYEPRYNRYKNIRINNFCGLESAGRIHRGESMQVNISGPLTRNASNVKCHLTQYVDPR